MVDFYTQRIPEHWYYSNFFPERHFETSDEAIEFEKLITLPHFPRNITFYERDLQTEPEPWVIDSNDNYQTPVSTPGFKQIPYTYKIKKVFITIEEDKISYYYFNEDTMQYELLETIQESDKEYIHSIFYDNPGINPVEGLRFGLDEDESETPDLYIEVKDEKRLIEGLTDDSVEGLTKNCFYYAKKEKVYFWKDFEFDGQIISGSDTTGEKMLPSELDEYIKNLVIVDDIIYCFDYNYGIKIEDEDDLYSEYTIVEKYEQIEVGDNKLYFLKEKDGNHEVGIYEKKNDSIKQPIYGTIINIVNDISFMQSGNESQYYYSSQLENLFCYKKDTYGQSWHWKPLSDGKILFIKQSSVTEGYLNLNLEVSKDKWYVRICRNIYSTFFSIWRGIVKIGQAIGTFFKNLWTWLKGQRYFGTEITFYWGNNIVEVPSKNVLEMAATIISRDQIFQSIDTPKKFWYYDWDTNNWKKFNCERYENWYRKTDHYEHVKSRYEDLDKQASDGEVYYVTQTQRIYLRKDGTWQQCPIISDVAMKLFIDNNEQDIYKKYIFYCQQEKQCYKYQNGSWYEDKEHSSLDGLYEYADAIRQVLDYKDHLLSTAAIKEFNSYIDILNKTLGYSFPTNTNTLQPTIATPGDWGFYYYDKTKKWIKGSEAYELEIL